MKISVDAVKPGMMLGEDLKTEAGRFLLAKGTKLTEKHCRVMKIWGLAAVEIQGDSDEEAEADQPDPELLRKAGKVLARRLALNDLRHPAVRELARLGALRVARSMAEGGAPRVVKRSESRSAELETELAAVRKSSTISAQDLVSEDRIKLGSMGAVLNELVEIINNPRCSSLEIARVVEKDTTLTARLLRIVNSPFYGFPARIDTISRAVTVIGSRQLTTLAVGVAAIDAFRGIPTDLVDMTAFWSHSLLTGFCSRILASYTNTPNSERFFVAGLLHDIGQLLMISLLPRESALILEAARHSGDSLDRVERRALGFDHGAVGGHLLKAWNFPMVLENSVRHHHSPTVSVHTMETAVVHVSDIVAWIVGEGGENHTLPVLSATAWESLELPAVTFGSVIEQLDFLFEQTAVHFLRDG